MFVYAQILPITTIGVVELLSVTLKRHCATSTNTWNRQNLVYKEYGFKNTINRT
jgi:hypothetical protein